MVTNARSMDFLARLLDTVAEHLDIPREQLDEIDRRVRIEAGGDRHYIASIAALECQERHRRIAAALESGASVTQVAERFGVARQTVWRAAQST